MTEQNVPHSVTREALYEAVWSTAMHILAPRFGYTGRGLAKLCERVGIPVPPRGYWAMVRAGHTVTRPPLPPAPAGSDAIMKPVVGPVAGAREPPETPLFSQELEALRARLRAGGRVVLREDLRGQHTAIRSISEALAKWRAARTSAWERPPWRSVRSCPGVSRALERHALRMLDALSRRAQDCGIDVERGAHRGVAVKGTLFGVEFTIYVYEPVRRVTLKPKPKDSYYDHEYQHTGRVELGVTFGGYGSDRAWKGRPERVAKQLDGILPAVIVEVDDRLRTRAEWARQRQNEEERQRARAVEEAAREEERQRCRQLFDESARWQEAAIARNYVVAVERELVRRDGAIRAGSEAEQWLAWARRVVAHLDPLPARVPASR